ncbi:hypothetical protein EV122DRAFT_226954, partial [Schizophyllum commune]
QVRIRSEHAVGYLKGRFPSLKGLRQQIKDETDHLRALEWIRTCLILHTLIQDYEQDSVDEEWQEECIVDGLSTDSDNDTQEHRRDEDIEGDLRRESAGGHKRRRVKEALFNSEIAGIYD